MILGYPSAPSLFPGETILFHVSTDAVEFRVELHRVGATLELQGSSVWLPGTRFPELASHDDWSKVWRGHAFPIPASFPPGVYVAMFIEGDGAGNDLAAQKIDKTTAGGPSAKALFVVRNPAPGTSSVILYKLPLFTYCAYNAAGDPGGSLYTWPGRRVTLHRPGNGTGGTPWDVRVVDVYDATSPRQTFAHWDEKLIRWLATSGREVDFATDLDVHRNDGDFLSAYRLLLSVGHDEYWSAPMREHVEELVARGGNVAFFSANVCYWRVTVEEGEHALSVDKRVHPGERLSFDRWRRIRPENTLTGVGYDGAGGQWNGPRPSGGGYTVRRAGHWVFEGTGLTDGSVFGQHEALVGYECDGAAFTTRPDGTPVTTGADCSPLDFEILATAAVGDWEGAMAGPASAATMGIQERKGIVFTAATVDWPRVVALGNPIVERITRNVLDRLSARRVRVTGPFPSRCGRPVAVEGETGTFYVDTSDLPTNEDLVYRWSVSGGEPGPLDGPTLSLTLPPGRAPITVSVVVGHSGAVDPPFAAGSITVQPFTRAELAWFEMSCELDELMLRGRPPEKARMRPGEGAACLPAHLQDSLDPEQPFFQRPESPPEARFVAAMIPAAERLAALARRLLHLLGGTP